ncbi:hypothetical protein ACQJBY_068978 [Aegilops geniculata]
MGASSSSSSFSSDSWIGSDRTCGGASTSSSLDASNYRDLYRDPPSEWMYNQILEAPFWSHEASDAVRASWRDEYEACDDAFVGFILECMEQKQKLSVSGYQEWLFQESQNEQKFANSENIQQFS